MGFKGVLTSFTICLLLDLQHFSTTGRTLSTLEESSPTEPRAITANNCPFFYMLSLILQYVQTHRQGIFIHCKFALSAELISKPPIVK